MDEPSTHMLMDVLKSADPADLEDYTRSWLSGVSRDFVIYMDGLVARSGLKRQEIFQRADLPRKYGYKLLSGEAHTADRDKLLRIFLALELELTEVQRGLELYGLPPLYPKNRRDAALIIAINRRICSVDRVNELLESQGEAPLNRSPD